MIKKSLFVAALVAIMCVFAQPANAQFGKKLGKSLGKAAKDAGKAVEAAATDMALSKASVKIVEFMDQNNTVLDEESEYTKRLTELVGTKFTTAEGKELNYKVYENEEANVIALTDGSIRIYTGMMDLLDDEELVGLLALEASHIATGNTQANLLKAVSGENAENAAGAQVEKLLSMSGDGFGTIVNELLQVPYTVEQNAAADKFAISYLKKNKVDADCYYSLMSKFNELKSIDLEDEELDEEDATVVKATLASKFLGVNSLRGE